MSSDLEKILFLDIEIVPGYRTLDEVPLELREIWIELNSKKRRRKATSDDEIEANSSDDSGWGDAGLKAEFGKVICVSLGRFEGDITDEHLKTHSIFSHDEREILIQLSKVLEEYSDFQLCAHNGKGFDYPFLGKRYLINSLPLPSQLSITGKKPWEVPLIDTLELWAFGAKGNGNSASLKLLCALFNIPCPKDDISGADVRHVHYDNNDLERIVKYCEKDVVSLAKVFRKLCGPKYASLLSLDS